MIDFNHKEVFDHIGHFILPGLFVGDGLRRFYENAIQAGVLLNFRKLKQPFSLRCVIAN